MSFLTAREVTNLNSIMYPILHNFKISYTFIIFKTHSHLTAAVIILFLKMRRLTS